VGGTLNDIGGIIFWSRSGGDTGAVWPSIFNVGDSSRYILENRFGEMIKDGKICTNVCGNFWEGGFLPAAKRTFAGIDPRLPDSPENSQVSE